MQVFLLLFLCVSLVLYGFMQPYKSLLVNILEVVVDLSFIFLLLLVSSQILDPYYDIPQTKITNETSTCGSNGRGVATVTWILTPLYYFPLIFLAGVCLVYFVHFFK